MTLAAFFEAARPWLEGQGDLRPLGATPSTNQELAFYPWLLAWDQDRILAELQPEVKRWVELRGLDWSDLARAFFTDCPPTGWSVPHAGAPFADWLATRCAADPRLPPGLPPLADLVWTCFLARTAPDEGPDLDRRVFVRHYAHDPRAARRALAEGAQPAPAGPATLLVFRHEPSSAARLLDARAETLAVLLQRAGLPLPGALAALPGPLLARERERLEHRGVLPRPAPAPVAEERRT